LTAQNVHGAAGGAGVEDEGGRRVVGGGGRGGVGTGRGVGGEVQGLILTPAHCSINHTERNKTANELA